MRYWANFFHIQLSPIGHLYLKREVLYCMTVWEEYSNQAIKNHIIQSAFYIMMDETKG